MSEDTKYIIKTLGLAMVALTVYLGCIFLIGFIF